MCCTAIDDPGTRSKVHLFGVPLGTALGIYGLCVLLQRETESLFRRA